MKELIIDESEDFVEYDFEMIIYKKYSRLKLKR